MEFQEIYELFNGFNGAKARLTAKHSNTVITGTLKYANEDIYILKDDFTGTESIYPSRCYTLERLEEKRGINSNSERPIR